MALTINNEWSEKCLFNLSSAPSSSLQRETTREICNSIDKIFQSQTTIKTKNNRALNTRLALRSMAALNFTVFPPHKAFATVPAAYAWYGHKSLMAERLNGNNKIVTIHAVNREVELLLKWSFMWTVFVRCCRWWFPRIHYPMWLSRKWSELS